MGRFFLYFFIALGVVLLLFFPIVTEADAHFDLREKRVGFAVFFYRIFKIFGGYATTYAGGIALHLSKNKAVLIPYDKLDRERKRFSFTKSFKPLAFCITTETGAEYLFPIALANSVLRAYFFMIGGKKGKIENNLWLTDGDVLKISLKVAAYFNLFTLLCAFFKFLKEKLRILWQKNTKKSIT
jgi:hypothetical protein